MMEIYLDNNATTPVLLAVWEAMRPFLTRTFGNPASAHRTGRRARRVRHHAPLSAAYYSELVCLLAAVKALEPNAWPSASARLWHLA
jgi:hypothetical protein